MNFVLLNEKIPDLTTFPYISRDKFYNKGKKSSIRDRTMNNVNKGNGLVFVKSFRVSFSQFHIIHLLKCIKFFEQNLFKGFWWY